VPPLRDRHADISLLVSHFAKKHGERHQRSIERIDRRTLRMFESYHWPGNIRELENLVERAVILSRGGTLRLEGEGLPLLAGQVSLDGQLREQEPRPWSHESRGSALTSSAFTRAAADAEYS
jgi:DNA-binding NtrC family response regulator